MKVREPERRISRPLQLKTALRVRAWKSGSNEQRAESENLSERGIFFATDAPLAIGSALEILLKMPEEITGEPTTEWRCTGHVVRLEPVDTPQGKLGVGVQFDCYEILGTRASKTIFPPLSGLIRKPATGGHQDSPDPERGRSSESGGWHAQTWPGRR